MQPTRKICALSFLFLVLSAATASRAAADPITLISDLRLAQVRSSAVDAALGETFHQQVAPPSDAIGIGVESLRADSHAGAAATVISSFGDLMHLGGEGEATAIASSDTGSADAFALSFFGFEFQTTEALAFSLDTNINISGDGGWTWAIAFLDAASRVDVVGIPSNDLHVTRQGILPAGHYIFAVQTRGEATASGGGAFSSITGYTFALDFAEAGAQTPEPASLLLLGTGIAGLVRRRARPKTGATNDAAQA